MAKDVTKNPWTFDAATQGEGTTVSGAVFNVRPYIKSVVLETDTTGGDFDVLDGASGDTIIGGSLTLAADSQVQIIVENFVDGVYINALPSGATVTVYHGRV